MRPVDRATPVPVTRRVGGRLVGFLVVALILAACGGGGAAGNVGPSATASDTASRSPGASDGGGGGTGGGNPGASDGGGGSTGAGNPGASDGGGGGTGGGNPGASDGGGGGAGAGNTDNEEGAASAGHARITVGGQAWDFVLTEGFFGCSMSGDGSELRASGSAEGAPGTTFSAILHPFGVGTRDRLVADNIASLILTDDTNHQTWMADATDPAGLSAALEAIPGGSSQIDTLTIEGDHAWGSATFIERNAVFDAWSTHGLLPGPVVGTFDVRCAGS